MPTISVVIPVFRAEQTLRELHRRLSLVLSAIDSDHEIIFVDDRGGDASWDVIEEIARMDGRVRGIQLSRNFGQHAATLCGIARARGEWIATIDDDLEQAPEDIPRLLAKAHEGYALVYGIYEERSHAAWRNVTSALARRAFRAAIPNLNDQYSSLRIFRRETGQAIAGFDSPFPFVDGYLSWVTNECATVTVRHSARAHGRSGYGVRKLLIHTINIFVTFSDMPLRIATWLGLGSFLLGMAWLAGIVVMRLLGNITVSGFASVMAGIVLFGGLQLLILGIFGEYLGRINFKSSRKPLFVVRRITAPEERSAKIPDTATRAN